MNAGIFFFVIAVILFFLAAVGSTIIPTATSWGFVFLTLGLLFQPFSIPWRRN